MNYEIRLGREIINNLLHLIIGAAVAHTFLAYLPVWLILAVLLLAGAGREYWQHARGKIQPWWVHTIDTVTIALGGLIWWLIITHFNVNIDLLMIPMLGSFQLPLFFSTFKL